VIKCSLRISLTLGRRRRAKQYLGATLVTAAMVVTITLEKPLLGQ
jgi:hypothetical protein